MGQAAEPKIALWQQLRSSSVSAQGPTSRDSSGSPWPLWSCPEPLHNQGQAAMATVPQAHQPAQLQDAVKGLTPRLQCDDSVMGRGCITAMFD